MNVSKKGFDELKEMAAAEGHDNFIKEDDSPLHFYCECSDENCRKRVILKPSHYNEIHRQRDKFVIMRGHETPSIEKVIGKEKEFWIVEKFVKPPESASSLNQTEANNT